MGRMDALREGGAAAAPCSGELLLLGVRKAAVGAQQHEEEEEEEHGTLRQGKFTVQGREMAGLPVAEAAALMRVTAVRQGASRLPAWGEERSARKHSLSAQLISTAIQHSSSSQLL